MEAAQLKPRKSKNKKKKVKSVVESENVPKSPSETFIEEKLSNVLIEEKPHNVEEVTINDTTASQVEEEATSSQIQDSQLEDTKHDSVLNDLDALSLRNNDILSKSQLNVYEAHDEPPPSTSESHDVAEVEEKEKEPSQMISESSEVCPQVDQLYPSLDDGFYSSLQNISQPRLRSISQQSSYNLTAKDDVDVLSLQNAEAQLDYIAPAVQEDPAFDSDLKSFDVIDYLEGDNHLDLLTLGGEANCTLHHLSLQTLACDDNYGQRLQSGYQSQCTSPAQSIPSFEDLDKELLISELKYYYQNPQLAKNDEFIGDFLSMCENTTHELHHLLIRYQKARQDYLSHQSLIESNFNKVTKSMDSIWTHSKEKKIESGYCADHLKVNYTENCSRALFHSEVLKEVTDNLESLCEICSSPLALLQYNWKITFYHVEQFMVRLVSSIPVLSDFVVSDVPGVSVPWDHVNHTHQLRLCVSILFYFKRQNMADEVFSKDIDRWLNMLVSVLLRAATLLDHRFLLSHLLRCPTGFSFWGTHYLQFVWTENPYSEEGVMGPHIIDHFFLMYLTLILPLRARDTMLAGYVPPLQDSDPSEWALLDEVGEASCDGKQLLERDYLELLGQLNFGMFYRELLRSGSPEEFLKNRKELNEHEMMKLFSMCLQCISYIKDAFSRLDFTRYRNYCQRNANIMTTFMRFVSDYYYFFDGYGGNRLTVDTDHSRLLTVHNFVIEEGFRCLAETSNVSLWQFLTDLPYHRISIKVLWKLYCFLHQVNPDKHVKSSVLRDNSPYEIVTKLYKTARFQRRLESLSDEDCTFMVNVFCKMAISRTRDENFVKVIGLDIYHIGVTSTAEKQSTDHACKHCISNIIDHCPDVVSVIINNIDKQTLKDLPSNLRLIKGVSLQKWLPRDADFNLLTSWLQSTPITSLTNQLSRVIIKGLNWGSHNKKLFIPADYHRKMAVLIVAAHSFHLPDRPGYFISSSANDFAKHISNSDKNQFVCWSWETLLSLCLNKTDLTENDALTLRITKQQQKQLRRQKSEGAPSAPLSEGDHSKLLRHQSFSLAAEDQQQRALPHRGLEDQQLPVGSGFVGTWGKFPYRMKKETGLNLLCEALRTNGEMAAFVALSITTIGHLMQDFRLDGIQLLLLLQKPSGYHCRATVQVLFNLLSIALKSKCLDLLLQLPDFQPLLQGLAKAEFNGAFTGKASKPLCGFITAKLVAAYQTSTSEGNTCLKFWVDLFFSAPNFHTDPAIVHILDKVCCVVFRYHGDEQYLINELRLYLNRSIEASKRNSSKILSIVSWFSSIGYVTSLFSSISSPSEVFWWSYYVTRMECSSQFSTGFFRTLTEVLFTNREATIDVAFRRAMSLLRDRDREELSNLAIPSIAIYRWGSLLQSVPKEHPLLPYAWREFFKLYFYRIAPEMEGVGFRYYQGIFQVRDLRAIKQRLANISKDFEMDEEEDDVTEEVLFRSKLSHFFLSLSLWTDETRLHQANLFVPGLPQQYSGDKLLDIIMGNEVPWVDMVDMVKIDRELAGVITEYLRYTSRRYTPRTPSKQEETAECLVGMLYSYVTKNMTESAPPPDLVLPPSHIPPTPDLMTSELVTSQAELVTSSDPASELIALVGPYFGKLRMYAEKFVEQTTRVKDLNKTYEEETPGMYNNRPSQRVEVVPCCNTRIGLRCTGPAFITVNSTHYFENTQVIENIAENRREHEEALGVCRRELDSDVCITAIFLEKIVSDLCKAESHRNTELGRALFYHVVEQLTLAVWEYPPSQQIFAFSIDYLGLHFIRNSPTETLTLLRHILSKTDLAHVLAPLFQPNQGFEDFVSIYSHVINSLSLCETEISFTVLSKFDVRSWLTTPHSSPENCKLLINAMYTGLGIYPYSQENTTCLMFYDTLKLHLRQVLTNRLCAMLQHVISKTLEISVKHPHHQSVWKEVIGVLESVHAQETLTLNVCHRILYELSKYFLQYKKSIKSSVDHDLYTHWTHYTENLIELFKTITSAYINKASFIARTEEQAQWVFLLTCSVFAPWLLVYEEACLPWKEAHCEIAGEMLAVYTDILNLMNNLIVDGSEGHVISSEGHVISSEGHVISSEGHVLSSEGHVISSEGHVTPLLNRFWWYYMEILGHPIVPRDVITAYYAHFTALPWGSFVPTLDILHSLLRCVRNNRNNIDFVIFLMNKVNWRKVVLELNKESHAFDMLVDVLITFALNGDIFAQFGQEFISLFRQFKSLDLSLVSDEGFTSIMSRIDERVQQNQFIQSISNTGHLIEFMGVLCRFPQQGVSYVKQTVYFQHVVNILVKISNSQYAEILVASLLSKIEHVFYTSPSVPHITDLTRALLQLFNNTPAAPDTHSLAVRKISAWLQERGSSKEAYSFTQLTLYYLSVLTSTLRNVRMQAVVCEVLIQAYFTHCENSGPVLSVAWRTLHERFHISDMTCDNFVNHSIQESCPLNIYLYTTHLLVQATDVDGTYSVVTMLIDAASRIVPKPKEEQKMLLLWFKIFEIMIDLHQNGIRSSVISSIIKGLPSTMQKLAEDRDTGGIFNNLFGKKSKYSLEFRMTTRIMATYVSHQINKDGSLRTSAGTRHNLTGEAGKAMDVIRSLVNNRAYASQITTLQHCIEMILDQSKTFLHTIELLRFLIMTFYSDIPYLASIINLL